jgi:hypothetical protein
VNWSGKCEGPGGGIDEVHYAPGFTLVFVNYWTPMNQWRVMLIKKKILWWLFMANEFLLIEKIMQ